MEQCETCRRKRPCKTWTINNKNNKKGSDIFSDILNLSYSFQNGKEKEELLWKIPLRISGVDESIGHGKGLRYTIFTQGCPHHCEGCHNPDTHDFEGGTEKEITAIYEEICSNPLLSGVTFSGGEPFCQPAPLAVLAEMVHKKGLNVTTYTGYTLEQLLEMKNPDVQHLLTQTDILIDGKFDIAQKDLSLSFRGSRNQRIIDVKQSLEQGTIVSAKGY